MKKLIPVFIFLTLLASCSNKSYSPLDTYINTMIETHGNEIKSREEAKKFIDSVNNRDIVIYNTKKFF